MITDYNTYTRQRDTWRDTTRDTSGDKVVEVRSSIEIPLSSDREVFAAFVEERKRHVPRALDLKPTESRLRRIRARLEEGLTPDQATEVARGIFYAENHVRDGWKDSTIDVAFRSIEHCDRFIRAFRENGNGAQAQRESARDAIDAIKRGGQNV